MNKINIGLLCIGLLFVQSHYYGSTTAPVTLAGGIIKAKHTDEVVKKYKRKDCPVCKGKGWYMSGDNIKKIDCTYCETDDSSASGVISIGPITSITPAPAPPTKDNCPNGKCPLQKNIRR
jgi:hypothetical protein